MTEDNIFDFGFGMKDMSSMLMMVMFMAMMPMVIQQSLASQQLQAQQFTGTTDPRTLESSGVLKWINLVSGPPYVGWVSVVVHNNGPGSVNIGINNPDSMVEMLENDTREWNFMGTNQRINIIYHKSTLGQAASIIATGTY